MKGMITLAPVQDLLERFPGNVQPGLDGHFPITDADLQELRWQTKHRIFLALLAELPEGSDAVMACAQLQAGKITRNRQSENTTGSSTDAYRRAESQLRAAFFAEVGRALESMGAPPALSAPKKLRVEPGVCLRAISFLAARVWSRQQRGSAPSAGIMDEAEMGSLFSFGGGSNGGDVSRPAGLPTMKQPRPYGRRRSTNFSSAGGVISTVSTSFETERAAARCVKTPSSPHTSLVKGCEAQAGETPKPRGKSSRERREFEILDGGSRTLSPILPVVTPGMAKEEEETTSRAVATFEEGRNTQHQSGVIDRKDAERGLGEEERETEEKGERESASQNYANMIRERPVAPATPTGRPLGRGRRDDKTRDGLENDVTPTVVVYPASSSREIRRGVTTPGTCRENPHRDSDASFRDGDGKDVSLDHDDSGRGDGIRSVRRSESLRESSSRARGTPPSILPRAARETPQRDSSPKVRARGGLTLSVSREAGRHQDITDSYGGSRDDGSRVGDAVGIEIGTIGVGRANRTADASGSVPKRRASLPHSPPSSTSGASADLANMEKTVAQNVFLRRRVEELQELVDSRAYTSFPAAAVEGRGARGAREKRDGRRVGAEDLETPSKAAACEIILRGQVEQLRRQVRLQHCAVDASAAVTREVKAVLVRLEAVLIELASLGESGDSVFYSGDAFHECKTSRTSTTARAYARRTDTTTAEEKVGASRVAGGVAGAAALPAWNQLLHRVETLSRQVRWAERAAQRAVDGRIHVTRDSSAFLKPHARGQRRPRDLRVRVLDPDHFTCPPPTHGAVHQKLQGALPVEGYASVVLETPASPSQSTPGPTDSGGVGKDGFSRSVLRERGERGLTAAGEAERAAEQAEQSTVVMAVAGGDVDADADTAVNIIPGIHQMYHLDAASVHGFGEAAAAATRSLEALLSCVTASAGLVVGMRDCGRLGNGKRGNGDQFPNIVVPCRIPLPGVVSMITDGGGDGNDAAIVDAIASVRDSFRGVVVAAAALGAVAPCAPEGAGAASEDSSSPALRLLRGVKAAGGARGARRVETLAIRLRAERAALEASAADAAVEAREWREAARQHAAAVLALAQGLRAAWKALIRKVSAASRALAAILDAMGNLSHSPEATAILRGSAGPFAAALLQTLSLFEPDLEDTASGMAHHLRRCEGEISRLWEVFEEAHLRNGGNVTVDDTVEEVAEEEDVDKKIPSEEGSEQEHG